METEKEGTLWRHQSFVPDSSSKDNISYYLSRTTFLWNYLVEATQAVFEDYLAKYRQDGPSEGLDDYLEKEVWAYFEDVYRDDYLDAIPQKWHSFIERVREIPRTMTEQRLTELLAAYKNSAKGETDTSLLHRNRPRRKTAKSAQSAMFTPNEFSIIDGFVRCVACKDYPVDIPLTGLARHISDAVSEDRILKIMVIKPHEAVTKGEVVDEFGPLQNDHMKAVFYLKP